MWQLDKDMAGTKELLTAEKDKAAPDRDLVAAYGRTLASLKAERKRFA